MSRRLRSRRTLRSSTVVLSASSLFGATIVTSALGFVFWAVAARLAPVAAVGSASAAISLMQLLGSLGTLGLGTLLIGELAARRTPAFPLVLKGVVVASAGGALLAAIVGLVLTRLSTDPNALLTSPGLLCLFAAGTAVTSATTVLDQALIGLARGGWQLQRNTLFAIAKLALLPLAAVTIGLSAITLYSAWLAGNLVSCLLLLRKSRRLERRWTWRGSQPLRGLGRAALAHHLMNVSSHAPLLILPVLVAAWLGPALNAAFYAAVLLSSFAWMASSQLSTALFSVPRSDIDALRVELRTSLRICAVVAVAAAVGGLFLATPVLRVFGPEYTVASGALTLLAIATAPSSVKSVFVAVRRVQGRLGAAAAWTTAGSALELLLGTLGLVWGGLTGLALGVLLALSVEACVFLPPVVGAARAVGGKDARAAHWPAGD